jgi:hypothetical protein
MHHTFSYKDASKHPKMASKYASCEDAEDEAEIFVIGNGWEKSWVNMTKKDLMTIPWMKEAIEGTDAKLFINDCMGFDINEITDAGAIHLKSTSVCARHLRIMKNTDNPSRYLLVVFYLKEDGEWELDYNYPREICSATVSANFGTLSDGFRVFADGPKKYLYNKGGEERLARTL